jgi:hypothetical protein
VFCLTSKYREIIADNLSKADHRVPRTADSSSRNAVNNSSACTTKRFPSPRAAQQQKRMEAVTARLEQQTAQIQKVSAQLEASKPAPQVVNNP